MKRSCWQRPLFRLLVLLYVLPCAALLLPFAKAGILSLWDHSVIPEKSYWASYLNTILLAAGICCCNGWSIFPRAWHFQKCFRAILPENCSISAFC